VSKVAEFTATEFFRDIRENPVIPAVRAEWKSLERALSGEHAGIFVLGGSIFELARIIEAHGERPAVFINVELIGGVAGDKPGLDYLAQHVEGVISTNRHVIEMANSVGLITVQRLFALDLGTTERGLKLIKRAKPDCVEILPALIKDRRDQHAILKAGAIGISTSDERLWKGA
jgi:glycerol uptake operon antiterminator